jgi:hypothetical protein
MILSLSSHVLFVLGYPEQALARSREALSEARQSGPHSLAFALSYAVELHREIGDDNTARELTRRSRRLPLIEGFLFGRLRQPFCRAGRWSPRGEWRKESPQYARERCRLK